MSQKEKICKRVKLWNRDTVDYRQIVRGDEVFIKAGGFIECSRRHAIEIRGHCTGKDVKARLEVEPIYEESDVTEVFIDHKSGQQFPTREALLKHLGVDPKAVAASNAKQTTVYPCPICDKTCNSKAEIVAHMPGCLAKVQK